MDTNMQRKLDLIYGHTLSSEYVLLLLLLNFSSVRLLGFMLFDQLRASWAITQV